MKYENYLIKIQYPLLLPSQCQLQCHHAKIFYVRHNITINHNSRQFKKRKKKKINKMKERKKSVHSLIFLRNPQEQNPSIYTKTYYLIALLQKLCL